MGPYIKKAAPACVGSSFGASFAQFFLRPGTWKIGDFVITFVVTYIITTIVISAYLWVRARIKN